MKYVNCLLFAGLAIGLCGCSSTAPLSGWDRETEDRPALADTAQYLPSRERDEQGRALPYEPEPNPYEELRGRVDEEAVNAYIQARRAFQEENFEAAEASLETVLEHEPELSGPWVMRGDMALEAEALDEAMDRYIQALSLQPLNFNAWLRLAKTQRMQGRFNRAQNSYARALSRWPDGAELHLNLGVLYDVYLNQPLKAQAHMEAYQLLDGGGNRQVATWLDELRERTGVATALEERQEEATEPQAAEHDQQGQTLAASEE